jgi:hypothetical protein
MMELMQGYEKDDGKIGVDDLLLWPENSHAVRFLSEIASASSIDELREACPQFSSLHLLGDKKDVMHLVSFSQLSARGFYRCLS